MTFAQEVRFNLYREVMLFDHHAIMTRSAKAFQRAIRLGDVGLAGLVHRARRKIHNLGLTCESGVWPRPFASSRAPSTSNASSG